MAGPRQPIDLIIHKGKKHLTKAEIEERRAKEVKAKSDSIEPPSFLKTKVQKESFEKYANELKEIGIMSNLDCDVLGKHIIYETLWAKVSEELNKMDVMDEAFDKKLNALDKIQKMSHQTASSLGLTISSRCKLVIPKAEEEQPKNKFSKFAR